MENHFSKGSSFAFLGLSLAKRPNIAAAKIGMILGIFGTILCLVFLAAVQRFLPIAQWGKSAASNLAELSQVALFFVAVVFAPVFETFVGQVIPIEFARHFRANKFIGIILGGTVFGLGHLLNGGVLHGLSAFIGGTVFSLGYVTFRQVGICPAFIAAATAHAVQNATLLFVIAPLFPEIA